MDGLPSMTRKKSHKSAAETEEFMGNKTANEILKPQSVPDENSKKY